MVDLTARAENAERALKETEGAFDKAKEEFKRAFHEAEKGVAEEKEEARKIGQVAERAAEVKPLLRF